MPPEVQLSVRGPVAHVTLERPPLNVLTTSMLDQLRRALEEADRDPAVRLVRLGATGKMFSAGVDVADHVGENIAPMMHSLTALFTTLEQIAVPLVSVVHGAALGGGLELVLATDLCFASDKASFGQPEIRLGLFAPPASVLLPRLVGERQALGLLLTGETISAAVAREIGLVNEVFPAAALEVEVAARLERLSALSGSALRLAKRAVKEARGLGVIEAHRRLERLYLDELMSTADAQEGLRAFLEKRPPRFRHE